MSDTTHTFLQGAWDVPWRVLAVIIASILTWFLGETLFRWLAGWNPAQRFALWRCRRRLRKNEDKGENYERMDDIYWGYVKECVGGRRPPLFKAQFIPLVLDRAGSDGNTPFASKRPKNLLILGEPGSGKSTLLQAMMLGDDALIDGIRLNDPADQSPPIPLQEVYGDLDRRIPIRANLRHFAPNSNSFPDWLSKEALGVSPYLKKHLLEKARLLLLLDGLDEVDGRHIDGVIHSINGFLNKNINCRAVITCRERHCTQIPSFDSELGFARYRIRKIDGENIKEIARRRLTSIDNKDKTPEDFLDRVRIPIQEPDAFDATAEPSSPEEDYRREPRIADLLQTPLLVTLALGAYVRNPEIPNNLAGFFQGAIGKLLHREGESPTEKECKRDLLRRVALESKSKADSGEFNKSNLFEEAQRSASRDEVAAERIETVVREITQSGLIRSKADDDKVVHEFSHPTFLEFLAAERLADRDRQEDPKGMRQLLMHAGERAWLQTGIYYSSLEDNGHACAFVSELLAESGKSPVGDPKRVFILGMAGLCASVLANGDREAIERLQREVVVRLKREIGRHSDTPQQLVVGLMSIARGGREDARESANRALSDAVPPEKVVSEIHWLGMGIARIGPLWASLWKIYGQRDRDFISFPSACGQLLDLMAEENGPERLAKLPRHYGHDDRPPLSKDPDLALEKVRAYYPWGKKPPNLAYLITVAALARFAKGALRPDWRWYKNPWWAFFFAATEEKSNRRKQEHWENLLEDKEREGKEKARQGFFRKLTRIPTALFGWWMALVPLLAGLGLGVFWANATGRLNLVALGPDALYPVALGLGAGLALFAFWRLVWCPLMRRLDRGSGGLCRLWAGQGTGNRQGGIP
uniref:AAA+ ATPase domain-containing protein n=1 Tax=Candidatus Kentrum eta TaxID=2126337 RepID=A0A450UCL4_9GAMM|nr:MAG: hypothetical protein BECKH772A_GA0070896_1000617 [Candidatus Kentron sp. H]VFJ89968.1 MAG: hypothetical protein BECKH772B_GA0070898_1000717 [Candidatus Kentron sp. H]VFJ96344.1 MAG: hypothetical protein BECKH772C_GA0070978_1000617 [Candidatus Kentron sp. H]